MGALEAIIKSSTRATYESGNSGTHQRLALLGKSDSGVWMEGLYHSPIDEGWGCEVLLLCFWGKTFIIALLVLTTGKLVCCSTFASFSFVTLKFCLKYGWTVLQVFEVLWDMDAGDVEHAMAGLVQKSLVRMEPVHNSYTYGIHDLYLNFLKRKATSLKVCCACWIFFGGSYVKCIYFIVWLKKSFIPHLLHNEHTHIIDASLSSLIKIRMFSLLIIILAPSLVSCSHMDERPGCSFRGCAISEHC